MHPFLFVTSTMKLFLNILFILQITRGESQTIFTIDDSRKEDYLIIEMGSPELLFVFDEETNLEYAVKKSGDEMKILFSAESIANSWGYIDHPESFYENDTIFIKVYKHLSAKKACFLMIWNGKELEFAGISDEENPNEGAVKAADSLLVLGRIRESVSVFHGIQYPYNEFNTWQYGILLMEKAHEIASEQFKQTNYDSAAVVMNAVFEYWENSKMLGFSDRKEFINDRAEGYYSWTDEQFILWVGDYGLFLYKANKLEESILINEYMTRIHPEIAGPYLQLGDGYFDLRKTDEAKATYKKYCTLKKAQGKENDIPLRVKERTK